MKINKLLCLLFLFLLINGTIAASDYGMGLDINFYQYSYEEAGNPFGRNSLRIAPFFHFPLTEDLFLEPGLGLSISTEYDDNDAAGSYNDEFSLWIIQNSKIGLSLYTIDWFSLQLHFPLYTAILVMDLLEGNPVHDEAFKMNIVLSIDLAMELMLTENFSVRIVQELSDLTIDLEYFKDAGIDDNNVNVYFRMVKNLSPVFSFVYYF